MVRIKWLRLAKDDLKDIYNYINIDSKRYANLQIERIQRRTQVLKKQILLGKIVEELGNPRIRELQEGNYRILYRIVSEKEVHILMIHHNARDLRRHLK